MSDTARLKATVFVGGLHPTVQAKTLHDAFIPFGEIADVSLPRPEAHNAPESHRGYGYIEFSVSADAADAIDNMDQAELFGRVIRVAAAKPSQNEQRLRQGRGAADGVLGSRIALWEQEGWLSRQGGDLEIDGYAQGGDNAAQEAVDPGNEEALKGLDVAGPMRE